MRDLVVGRLFCILCMGPITQLLGPHKRESGGAKWYIMMETGWHGLAGSQGKPSASRSWKSQEMDPRPVGPPEGTSILDFSPPGPES